MDKRKKKNEHVRQDKAAADHRGARQPAESATRKGLSDKDYQRALRKAHVELVKLQEWVKFKGLKVCVVFEGRDGAGKGGTIKAMTERVSPRVFRVIALPAPTEREKSQMYLQRYLPHLPAAGEVVIFDRSWYNRAGVERVMGFCAEQTARKFLQMVPLFEKMMIESGIVLVKYWLEVNEKEQTRRLAARIEDGRKIWKLSPMDLKSYSRWYDYSKARDEMFNATDTSWAPWFVAHSDDKKKARLNIITHFLSRIPYEDTPREKVKLPKRQKAGDYREPDYSYKVVPEEVLTRACEAAEMTMRVLRAVADPTALGVKWLRFWNYVGLPAGAVIAFLMFFELPRFRYEMLPVAALFAAVAFGLHRRKLWGWQWNIVALAIAYLAFLVPVPIRTDYGGFVYYIAHGTTELMSLRWVRDSLGDLVEPFAIRLVLASVLWLWPNWIYWQKREALFS